jgi:hypothetical protein
LNPIDFRSGTKSIAESNFNSVWSPPKKPMNFEEVYTIKAIRSTYVWLSKMWGRNVGSELSDERE